MSKRKNSTSPRVGKKAKLSWNSLPVTKRQLTLLKRVQKVCERVHEFNASDSLPHQIREVHIITKPAFKLVTEPKNLDLAFVRNQHQSADFRIWWEFAFSKLWGSSNKESQRAIHPDLKVRDWFRVCYPNASEALLKKVDMWIKDRKCSEMYDPAHCMGYRKKMYYCWEHIIDEMCCGGLARVQVARGAWDAQPNQIQPGVEMIKVYTPAEPNVLENLEKYFNA